MNPLLLLALALGLLGGCVLDRVDQPLSIFGAHAMCAGTALLFLVWSPRNALKWLVVLGSAGVLLSCAPPAQAAEPIDLRLMLERAVRLQESGGEADCTITPGAAGEIGCYQIKAGTARQVGFTGPAWMLWIPDFNRAWASEILRQCAHRHRRNRYPLRAIGQCYNQGFRARVGKGHDGFAYGQRVADRYHAALLARAKQLTARN